MTAISFTKRAVPSPAQSTHLRCVRARSQRGPAARSEASIGRIAGVTPRRGAPTWNSGLVRFGARDYDAAIARWTAKDLIGFAGLQANVYVYVGNDPVNFADPEGLLTYKSVVGGAFFGGGLLIAATGVGIIPGVALGVVGIGIIAWDYYDSMAESADQIGKARQKLETHTENEKKKMQQLKELDCLMHPEKCSNDEESKKRSR